MERRRQRDNRFLIITGLSGSGKTAVIRYLEDLGYYCIDNIPAKLIMELVKLWLNKKVEMDKVALVMDIREPNFVKDFPGILEGIRRQYPVRLIFLEASDDCLVKRFSETRRPHPLGSGGRSTLQAVRLERKRLDAIKQTADDVIDTSDLNLGQLKEQMSHSVLGRRPRRLRVVVISFGYKYGVPLDSDLVFDTRFLPNPFYLDNLRGLTGKSARVRNFVMGGAETQEYLKRVFPLLDFLVPRVIKEGKSVLTVSIGCTGGRHRSVVIAEEVRKHLKKPNLEIKIYHRDLFK